MRRSAAAGGRTAAWLVVSVGRSYGASKCNDLVDIFRCGQHEKWIKENVEMKINFCGFKLLDAEKAGKLLAHHALKQWVKILNLNSLVV